MHKGDNTVLTVSPPDSGFSPRREFVPENHVSSTFALLAIAGPGLVRLTSFSSEVILSIKSCLLSHMSLRSRTEHELDLVEIDLSENPWANTKSAETETLFVDLFAIILQHGYTFLSALDYGRDAKERVSMAFSKPASLPNPQSVSVPFALSFVSSKLLRVINPPLHMTPAILHAARSSWPKGMVSERKVSDKCYEFRLRGSGWFYADTFALDAQQQILFLLSTLDRHTFSLLASLSLNGKHAKTKDLWIFSGLADKTPSSCGTDNEEIRGTSPMDVYKSPSPREGSHPVTSHTNGGYALQEPAKLDTLKHAHARSFSENDADYLARNSQRRMRVDTAPDLRTAQKKLNRISEASVTRKDDLSPRSSIDMTGIGSGIRKMFVSNHDSIRPSPPDGHELRKGKNEAMTMIGSGHNFEDSMRMKDDHGRAELPSAREETNTAGRSVKKPLSANRSYGEDLAQSPATSYRESQGHPSDMSTNSLQTAADVVNSRAVSDFQSTIMNSGVFRDSAFSSNTDHSYDFPRAWTDLRDKDNKWGTKRFTYDSKSSPGPDEGFTSDASSEFHPSAERRSVSKFFGRRQSTPMAEIPEERASLAAGSIPDDFSHEERRGPTKKVVAERVATPEMSVIPGATRKSETALYESTTHRRTNAPKPQHLRSNELQRPPRQEGWVLITIKDDPEQQPASPFRRLLSLSKLHKRPSPSNVQQASSKNKRRKDKVTQVA